MFNIKINVFYVKYLSGLNSSISSHTPINIFIEEKGISFKIAFSKKIFINWLDILNISIQDGDVKEVSTGKAAAGLILFGPVGALLGAGLKSNKELMVKIKYKNEEGIVSEFIFLSKNVYQVYNRIIEARSEYFKMNNIQVPYSEDSQSNNLNDLEYLEKLHSLKEKGVITEEEFEKRKSKII